jgi:hypothetical protein
MHSVVVMNAFKYFLSSCSDTLTDMQYFFDKATQERNCLADLASTSGIECYMDETMEVSRLINI